MRRIEVGGNFGAFLCSRCYVLCFAIMFYVSKSFSGMSSHKHKHNITRQKLCVYVLCYVYDKNISVKTQLLLSLEDVGRCFVGWFVGRDSDVEQRGEMVFI